MRLGNIKLITDIKEGDQLLVRGNFVFGGNCIQLHKVEKVKVSENDGTEIILQKKGNVYFNLGMYLKGDSWVKEVRKVKI